ncbi:MAG: TatD family hydrolase [Anaerolineales bacterium]
MFVDTHCHLNFDSFENDRQEVLERARQAAVRRILNPGVDLASSRAAVELAQSNEQVYAAVGVHPNDALSWNEGTIDALEELAEHPKVVAIGEIGLDYYRERAPRDLQMEIFGQQLLLAERVGLPVVIHNREATADILGMLEEWQMGLMATSPMLADRPGVLHSYSDNEANAMQAIDLNFFIGITGPVTFHNAPELQHVVTALPIERLLTETDAPFLTPHPHRGKRNEPAYVRIITEKIAQLRELPVEIVAEITENNAGRLFNWLETP